MTAVKLDISLEKRRKAKERHDSKFLEIHELHAFLMYYANAEMQTIMILL